jgi:hypothetical protein
LTVQAEGLDSNSSDLQTFNSESSMHATIAT